MILIVSILIKLKISMEPSPLVSISILKPGILIPSLITEFFRSFVSILAPNPTPTPSEFIATPSDEPLLLAAASDFNLATSSLLMSSRLLIESLS
ncbi:MAG: hypothetical protein ACRC78_12690 [Planktothrix sp.]